jgi:hypothetical protein
MSLIGLDLNASRARAAHGPAASAPQTIALEGQEAELPLALNLEGRHPIPGRAGLSLCRRAPHMACLDFLPQLGLGQSWSVGKHRLDAAKALSTVFEQLGRSFGTSPAVAFALPPYLNPDQESVVAQLAGKAGWRLLRLAPTPLTLALAAKQHLPLAGAALILDVDAHALTWSAVAVQRDHAQLLTFHPTTRLGLNTWLNRLIEQCANRCILLSRRDPRESAEAEQSLCDQMRRILSEGTSGARVDVSLTAKNWSQHLMFTPDELAAFCLPLAHQALAQLQSFLPAVAAGGPIGAVLVTHAASCLPGLMRTLETTLPALTPPSAAAPSMLETSDFGDNLLIEEGATPPIQVLEPDAAAKGAHELGGRAWAGELDNVPYGVLPLPPRSFPADKVEEVGPARLEFRGQEHVLSGPLFTLGRDPSCNLVFETELYPTVSARHCEIAFDRQIYTLRDRSRHGTLVNDQVISQPVTLRPGDWIRLGPVGPVVRFLGQGGGKPSTREATPFG